MNPTPPAAPIPDPVWEDFAARHPDDPRLKCDPLYSLTPGLITRLADNACGLLEPADVEFETDLFQATRGGGFFQHHWFADPLQEAPTPTAEEMDSPDPADELHPDHQRLFEPYVFRPRDLWKEDNDHQNNVLRRRRAYVVWLVCNREFRQELAAVRQNGPPIENGWFLLEPDACDARREDNTPPSPPWGAFTYLYRKWGLKTLCTWDYPLPLRTERRDPDNRVTVNFPGPGMVVFIPWFALRDRTLDLQTLAGPALRSPDLRHLADWLYPNQPGEDRLGYDRLEHMFLIYRYSHLGLRVRYQDRMRRRVERLDSVLADHWGLEPETIRKLRPRLTRDLKKAEKSDHPTGP